ncbi:MAG: hypothetical protein LUF84_05020 [Clostridiales bacterium]|nr:hypothetical protein [Clostridiales bacterium]
MGTVRRQSRVLSRCAMLTALGVVLMLTLGFTGVGTYAAPLLAALLVAMVQEAYGTKTALTMWLATGLLALLLVTDRELSVVYLTIFGWYPAVKPHLDRLPRPAGVLAKLALFNGSAVATYAALIPFLGLEEELLQPWLLGVMLAFGNALFWVEDRLLLPRLGRVLRKRLKKWF